MNHTVFYSWQSDLENKFNRGFIQEVLNKAVKNISNNKDFNLEAVIDRDTYGVPGSPAIVESITGKIAKSDVFVCDVSIINSSSKKRRSPNPNVLFELGFASAILGWDRIIMIQNEAYGGPDKLPFDLRGRRILSYYLNETTNSRSEERKKLLNSLVATFEEAFRYYKKDYFGIKEKPIWWGKWELESDAKVHGGQLYIHNVSSDAFFFDVSIVDGERTGGVGGKAQIMTPHSGFSRIKTPDGDDCEILLRRRFEKGSWYLEVEEGIGCENFHGMASTFSGTYKHYPEPLVIWGRLDEIDIMEIERLTGKYLSIFLENFQQINAVEYKEENYLAVVTGGVKGMYTIMESIVVHDNGGTIWCACLDPEKDVCRYFTNDEVNLKPSPIVEWLSQFTDKPMIVNDSGRHETE